MPTALSLERPPRRAGWSHRLAWPRTEPSQGSDTGSNPVGTTTLSTTYTWRPGLSGIHGQIRVQILGSHDAKIEGQPHHFEYERRCALGPVLNELRAGRLPANLIPELERPYGILEAAHEPATVDEEKIDELKTDYAHTLMNGRIIVEAISERGLSGPSITASPSPRTREVNEKGPREIGPFILRRAQEAPSPLISFSSAERSVTFLTSSLPRDISRTRPPGHGIRFSSRRGTPASYRTGPVLWTTR